jgi:hypothetical protein
MKNEKTIEQRANAHAFRARRDMHPGRASTVRKLIRAARIYTGERPLKMPRIKLKVRPLVPWMAPMAIELHPTKGFRKV